MGDHPVLTALLWWGCSSIFQSIVTNIERIYMHPTIISLGPLAIRGYGLMLAIGFLTGIIVAARRAQKLGENPDNIYNLAVWIVISSLIGARLYYVFSHFDEFRAESGVSFFTGLFIVMKNIFWPIGPDGQVGISGLVLYGGLICATAATAFYLKKHDLSIMKYMDILAPSLGLGEFFTRIGCFLNGCCFGHPTDSVFGMIFPGNSAAGYFYPGTPIHPAQLYNSFAGLAIFVLLITFERYRKFYGFTALLYFVLYATGRFIIDYFRYYESSMTFLGLSHSQILSLGVFVVSAILLVYFSVRFRNRTII
ncbi:prolipoprotein diacylglyceryl transferase [bacterium]|nr:prolipoprotein diacylglyceryl transferase [bacterium]